MLRQSLFYTVILLSSIFLWLTNRSLAIDLDYGLSSFDNYVSRLWSLLRGTKQSHAVYINQYCEIASLCSQWR